MKVSLLRTVILKTMPVMAGYVVLGIGFGLLLKVNGYGLFWALLMSVLIYAGSMQYVGISLLAGHASLLSVAVTTLMVNARHLFYGISMAGRYKGAGAKKFYLMHALTDETYSLVCTGEVPDGVEAHRYYFLISLFNQIYWITGSVIGSLLGEVLPFDGKGIDFSMTALFVTVFVEQWLSTKEHRPALLGLGTSALCLLIFGRDYFLIPAMFVILGVLLAGRRTEREVE